MLRFKNFEPNAIDLVNDVVVQAYQTGWEKDLIKMKALKYFRGG